MKKMFKAAASLAVGCALLSTSAFAALEGTVTKDETGATVVALTGYAEKAQSTILVVKGEAELDAIPADLADAAIAYINQAEAADGTISYDVNVSGDATYTVFAGGSDQDAATKIGAFTISSVVAVDGITISGAADGDKITVGNTVQLSAAVTPDNATDPTVTWTSSSDEIATVVDGLVTAKTAGNVAITAKAGDKTATINFVVEEEVVEPTVVYGDADSNGNVDIDDVVTMLKTLGGATIDGYSEVAADVDCSGALEIDDVILVLKWLGGADVTLGPATN